VRLRAYTSVVKTCPCGERNTDRARFCQACGRPLPALARVPEVRKTVTVIAFARENGTVYHTYTVTAPDPFVAPFFNMLLERTPKSQPEEPRSWRKDEYPF
jgi:hypothetical protein